MRKARRLQINGHLTAGCIDLGENTIMKAAIVNRTNLKNYGSVLQVYALAEAVKSLGYEPCVVWESGNLSKHFDFRLSKVLRTAVKALAHPQLLRSILRTICEVKEKGAPDAEAADCFDRFVRKYIPQTLYTHGALARIAKGNLYGKFICGSDQVWCSTGAFVDPLMYLQFAPEDKRIAYAPSIGRDYIPSYNRREMRKYISGIPFVSVREKDGQRLINELTGRKVPVLLDPTLLLDKEAWRKIGNPKAVPEQKYILCYFLDTPTEAVQREIIRCAKAQGCLIVALGRALPYIPSEMLLSAITAGPSEFLSLEESACCVITDSYHGMLFAINFERDFWSVERNYRQFDQSSRQKSILEELELTERYQARRYAFINKRIDYQRVRCLLEKKKKEAMAFLDKALSSEANKNEQPQN